MTDLSDEELERYARQIVLHEIGGLGQRRLKAASVAVVGAGGIGSAAIPALAGAGVGRLTIIDDDVVEETNLHRQLIFRTDQVGEPKAFLAASFAEALNPFVSAKGVQIRLDAANAEVLLSNHRSDPRRLRQFRDPPSRQRHRDEAADPAGLSGGGSLPGPGRAVSRLGSRQALLSLLRRKRVRRRRL